MKIIALHAPALHSPRPVHLRLPEAWANRQPGMAFCARLPGTAEHQAFGLSLLRVHQDWIAEITNLTPGQLAAFGLPPASHDPTPAGMTTALRARIHQPEPAASM